MNKLIILTLLTFSVLAEEHCETSKTTDQIDEQRVISTDVPSHLKGATIIVKLADGRESQVPAELFKVVPRKQQFIVTRILNNSVTMCSREQELNKNRISVLGGRGPKDGLDKDINPSKSSISSKVGTVGGVQYQRMISNRISIGGQVQTNKSGLVSIGLDF